MSNKGKTPWMMYNGHAIADSQFCIEFLKQNLHVDTDKHLTKQEQAVARALRELTEENLYWYTLLLADYICASQILITVILNLTNSFHSTRKCVQVQRN